MFGLPWSYQGGAILQARSIKPVSSFGLCSRQCVPIHRVQPPPASARPHSSYLYRPAVWTASPNQLRGCQVACSSGASADSIDSRLQAGQPQQAGSKLAWLTSLAKTVGAVMLFTTVAWAATTRPAHAASHRSHATPTATSTTADSSAWASTSGRDDAPQAGQGSSSVSRQHQQPSSSSSSSYRYTGFDLADATEDEQGRRDGDDDDGQDEAAPGPSSSSAAAADTSSKRRGPGRGSKASRKKASAQTEVGSLDPEDDLMNADTRTGYEQWFDEQLQRYISRHPELEDQPEVAAANLREILKRGMPLGFDELMKSAVYAPEDVPVRMSKAELYEQVDAIRNQYNDEDFDLGIKQFMIEQQVQQSLESGIDMRGGNADFEERLSSQLFSKDKGTPKDHIRTEEVVSDAFTTEIAEEAATIVGESAALSTAWRVEETLRELAYTQLWTLVGEGHVDRVRFYGPELHNLMVKTKATAPGGVRLCKVVVPPDPDLLDHLMTHAVTIDGGSTESLRVGQAFVIQLIRYTAPFMMISFVFWILHTWILDPMPNVFRRKEFVRYRREMMHVASKLNFRSPARQVSIDITAPDFIPWDEIHGIDEVKHEITEIIDYLKNPALLRLKGVNRIGGVLLAGSPGTGKTLLAKSIAAESGVQMFSCSGTDFFDVYSGVGARRIRETFEKLRNFAPAILFVDEFDALGASRGGSSATGGEESANIINELLVQMDGFEDNRGIVVLGATNRPGAIDSALVRPGRFDRIIYMPLPDAKGRAKILQVHARGKAVDPAINWYEVARAMAGFTGADCMGLMARAARMAGRAGREQITEEDIYAAMESKAVEAYHETTHTPRPGVDGDVPDPIPLGLRKAIAVYEAGKALMAYITPEYEEIARVSVCPGGLITGYTLMVEDEDKTADSIMTRGDMESVMVVHLAGRSAEKLVMGEGEMTGLGAPDLFHANMVAREMVLECGMGRRMGPVDLMQVISKPANQNFLQSSDEGVDEEQYTHSTDMSTEQARVAMGEVLELLEAAEAKAYYGLAINWAPLQALIQALLDKGTLSGKEVQYVLEKSGVIHFPDPFTSGYGWDAGGNLEYPFKPAGASETSVESSSIATAQQKAPVLTGIAAKTWDAGSGRDAPRGPDGKFLGGWHYNSPYAVRTDLPDWFVKERERYNY